MATLAPNTFSIEDFLAEERVKDLFRFSTAGSVDDGKSTLIGRLLYDTQSVYEDQVRSIQGKGTTAPGQIDFALLTDGLRAEREQGITIDVAYRYFATSRRKFIIADTPGHEQYTRNMATGASTADATVVLLDASKGVLIQSLRHAYIASLLRVRHVLVAVNKMDLIGYDETRFYQLKKEFKRLLEKIANDTGNAVKATFVPVSALAGDNIVHRSQAMPWYSGPSLLALLESLPSAEETRALPFRFPVQRVIRPDQNFRGFAGQIASGTIHIGDKVTVLPSGREAEIARIVTFDGDLQDAHAPLSVTLVLDREVDVSRGNLLVSPEAPATLSRVIEASVVWMDEQPLRPGRRYLLKHSSQTVPAVVSSIAYRTNVATLEREAAPALAMNDVGMIALQMLRPIAVDLYGENRSTGAFILIDQESNHTVAAGMIRLAVDRTHDSLIKARAETGQVTPQERGAKWGHSGAVVAVNGSRYLIDQIERSLFAKGCVVARIDAVRNEADTEAIQRWAVDAGILVLLVTESALKDGFAQIQDRRFVLHEEPLRQSLSSFHDWLTETGTLLSVQGPDPDEFA